MSPEEQKLEDIIEELKKEARIPQELIEELEANLKSLRGE